MGKIKIEISTDNAAFEDELEVTQILLRAAKKYDTMDRAGDSVNLRDSNGNLVGFIRLEA